MARQCMDCSDPIEHCNGFVVAGDLLLFQDGKLKGEDIREICGRCVLIRTIDPDNPRYPEPRNAEETTK